METLATRFKALGDPTRLRLLALLRGGELCVCDLTAALELPQSTVSRHLALLKSAGWIRGRRGGVWTYYSLEDGPAASGADVLQGIGGMLAATPESSRDREVLEAYLKTKADGRCD